MENKDYQAENEEDNLLSFLDFRKLMSDVVRYWWIFVVTVAVAFVGLKIYHSYTTPVYAAEATLIIDNSGGGRPNSIMEGVALGQTMRNFDNQLAILGSRTLITNVVESMHTFITYHTMGSMRSKEIYPSTTLMLVMDSAHVQPLETRIQLTPVSDKTFSIKVEKEHALLYSYKEREVMEMMDMIDFEGTFYYGQPIVTQWCAFTVVCQTPLKEKIFACFHNPENLVRQYKSSFGINHDKKSDSSVLTLTFTGTNAQKNVTFLNNLIQFYINDNLNQKNQMSENTIKFIEEQLGFISDTLNRVGTDLSSFRSKHGIQNDLSRKGNDILNELKNYDKQIEELRVENAYYDYLENYLSNDSLIMTGNFAPATFQTHRPIIDKQINNLLELNTKKTLYGKTNGKDGNPGYDAVVAELNISRATLLTSIQSHKQMVNDNIEDVQKKLDMYNSELMSLPEEERSLLGIDRKFTLNNDVFTFLMRKRSEAQIQRASNTSDHKVLDAAIIKGLVSPNVKKNQILGLTAAILLPLFLFVIRQLLDTKIRTANDLKKMTPNSIIGEVPNSNKDTASIVLEYPGSQLAEEFRRMRIKLDFLTKGKSPAIISVSSAIPGDGKTFCSLNTASVYAIAKKKTVLIGFDLRRPGLSKELDIDTHPGITDYLIGNCTFEEIIVKIKELDVIPAGTIPPNPAELIQSDECAALMEELKKRYEVIILDTPPISLVSDALLLSQISDCTILVVRQDYTDKSSLKFSLESLQENGIKNSVLVINDINNKNTRYGYGYGYGNYGKKYGKYKYGRYDKYGYGNDN